MSAEFFKTLFDLGEHTCFSFDVKGVRVSPVHSNPRANFFSINPLHPSQDLQPTQTYHSVNRPRRADHNVVAYRNILIEMDQGTAKEQLDKINFSGIPWSTCVSSGGKSLHFIISLITPLKSHAEYLEIVRDIYLSLKTLGVEIDQANKNPSRFSRVPGVLREQTGTEQKLIKVYKRVDLEDVKDWLRTHLPAKTHTQLGLFALPQADLSNRIYQSTEEFLRSGAPQGSWNMSLFRAACNLFTCGMSLEEATSNFTAITGHLDHSDHSTINSAYRRIQSKRTG